MHRAVARRLSAVCAVCAGGAALLAAAPPMAASGGAVSPSGPRTVPGSRASTPAPFFFGDDPAVAAGADGTVAVAFSHLAPTPRHDKPARIQDAVDRRTILVAVRRPGGGWLPTQTVSRPGAASPRVAVDGRGGVLVVWVAPACGRRPQPAGCLGVPGDLEARSLATGGHWGPIVTLARNTSEGFDGPPAPSVALDPRGAATVAYAGARPRNGRPGNSPFVYGTYAVQRGAGGGFGTPRALPGLDGEFVAAMDDAGRAYVAGTHFEPGGDDRQAVYVSARGRTGAWRTGSRVSAISGSKPRIAVASDGEVVVAWIGAPVESDHLEYGPVLAALAKPGARHFSSPTQVSVASYTRLVRVVAGSAGETLVSWSNATEFGQPGRGLSYVVRPSGGGFGSQQTAADAKPGDAIDDGTVLLTRGGLGLWLSQRPFGERGGLLLAAREPGGAFSASRAIAGERWNQAVVASSSSIAAAVGRRQRVLRIVTVRP